VLGASLSIAFVVLTQEAVAEVEPDARGLASGIFETANAAPAADEDQASAGAQSALTALLPSWKAAVPLPQSRSMRQCDRGMVRSAGWLVSMLPGRSRSWPLLVMPPAGCRSAAGRDFIGA
jgi:hypothetical protein